MVSAPAAATRRALLVACACSVFFGVYLRAQQLGFRLLAAVGLGATLRDLKGRCHLAELSYLLDNKQIIEMAAEPSSGGARRPA